MPAALKLPPSPQPEPRPLVDHPLSLALFAVAAAMVLKVLEAAVTTPLPAVMAA